MRTVILAFFSVVASGQIFPHFNSVCKDICYFLYSKAFNDFYYKRQNNVVFTVGCQLSFA